MADILIKQPKGIFELNFFLENKKKPKIVASQQL